MNNKAKPEKINSVFKLGGRKVSVKDFSGFNERTVKDFEKALRILSVKKVFPQPNFIINE
ncbi:MAG: hypothetical protein UR39_C0001G0076 [Candidatus Woesebacteria bacterium GW2011_GWA1_33_30]|uniref:Uncharacterized protein n=1 Tax=Candidatus Woesebacteria bacterium GW2011_GWA2_33_28 TaxID=1618561 RepID=A0A0G0AAG1_9BACT|nr:MAG: hypothetical protein UR38_C0001G0077 [Candidatus Woesebacteria bacterium GW2011_GWA2_33_28]KKP49043.1 MAG: hypothetical protein UR39_C0001G0076 [Candidatus Woesebacteria bacterium GW2011_GWA1_33_30]KKP49849.1 MAG: hypothetical protein UR40_C0003G0021 [Microgenomates group bacterium GW2011_GWC1_33_32]KKP52635.1 MAG: hypothetical protein UR44_C0001G0077 [Candidatus Woesebacteria bacterium GW2011_GWB1_33_38]KKP58812.1 MAG: hypothetical protein UR48_C0001G0016 [Microgenomates group bacteriu